MSTLSWISPARADDMLFDDPMGSSPDFGFALMRPKAKGKRNTTADLARAKLQPSKPDDAAWGRDGLWPITCTTSRLVPAPRVAIDPDALEGMFEGYDARIKPHQKLLATVLTMRFDHGWQAADILSLVGMYALQHLALERRLTSLTVVHMTNCRRAARTRIASYWHGCTAPAAGGSCTVISSPRKRRPPSIRNGQLFATNGRRASRPAEQADERPRYPSRVPPAGGGPVPAGRGMIR